MRTSRRFAKAIATVVVLAVSGISGIVGATSTAAQSGGETLKIGLITAESGAFASSFGPSVADGARARLKQAGGKINGQKVELVVADTQSSPTNTLTLVRDLVENKGVFAIVAADPFLASAADYLKDNNIPTFQQAWAGFFFADNPEMFSIPNSPDPARPGATQWGKYFKFRKATKLAVFASAIPPSSGQNATAIGRSAEDAGLGVVYENKSVPLSGYDFTGDAQAVKDAGADAILSALSAADTIRLVASMKQAGVEPKAVVLLQGYDQATLDDPAIAAALEGTDLLSLSQPPSTSKAAKKMVKAMNKVGLDYTVPTFGAWNGYANMDLALFGLKELGRAVSATPEDRAAYIDALRQVSDYDAGGLLAGPYDLTLAALGTAPEPAGGCLIIVTLNDDQSDFVPIRKKPFCGEAIPGTEVITP